MVTSQIVNHPDMRLFRCDVQVIDCDASDYRGLISGSCSTILCIMSTQDMGPSQLPTVLVVQTVTLTEDEVSCGMYLNLKPRHTMGAAL
jgi:hypothetical protein